MTLERGALVNQRYRIVEVLGLGGMGSVYRAVDENLGVEVALKENLFTSDEYTRQFQREAVILANLRHPNLPRVTDHFSVQGQGQYLVMDFVEGEDLRQRMDRMGVLDDEEVVRIGVAVCEALNYLDSRTQPIVHRDIKPGNVKLTPSGQIYLVDFGLAKVIELGQATTTAARAMTPGYSPPEQYGTARTDHRSDIYSLGATLYAALTATVPEDSLARMMGQAQLTPIRERNPKVSPQVAAVIERALEVRPEDRYQTAAEFKGALLGALGANDAQFAAAGDRSGYEAEGERRGSRPRNAHLPGGESVAERLAPAAQAPQASSTPPASQPGEQWWRSLYLWVGLVALAVLGGFLLNARQSQSSGMLPRQTAAANSLAAFTPGMAPASYTPALATHVPTLATSRPASTAIAGLPTGAVAASLTPFVTATPVGGGSGQISFAGEISGTIQVWLMDLDGSNLKQLTNLAEGACQPDWSPDGARLVFTSPCKGNKESYPGAGLFIINVDGTNLTPLPNVPGGDYDPAWSPDGNFIAFTSLRTSGRPRLYLINLVDLSVERLSQPYAIDMQPAWSPDGMRIAFVSRQEGPTDIWVMDRDGGDQQRYTQGGAMINSHPAWSQDGNVLLFTQQESPGGVPNLAAASYNEGVYNEYRFELGPIPLREAKYSPDGLWLVVESWTGYPNHDIYIMSSSGASRTQISTPLGLEFDPCWRPVATPK